MINYTHFDLYKKNSVNKQLKITFDGGEIKNTDLYLESFELYESLCSESELRFGSCESSELKIKIQNNFTELNGKELTVSETLDGNVEEFQFGVYKVYSDIPSGDRNYRNIVAYDKMYEIINEDVSEWYNSLEFPMTLKEFRDSFFEYLKVEQEETNLINDDLEIEKTISGNDISGKLIIVSICELNGVFGRINRQNKFSYVSLATKNQSVIYPIETLYPSTELYSKSNEYLEKVDIEKKIYISCEFEDFNTQYISKIQIRKEENDIGASYGDGNNVYVIENNLLVYGKTEEELVKIAEKIFQKIQYVSYKPYKGKVKGNPCLEVGDALLLYTKYGKVESYILERRLSGIHNLIDQYSANGVYRYKNDVNGLQKEIQQLKGKSNVLERTLNSTRSEITDIEAGLNTKIEQNTEKINASVQRMETAISDSVESINGNVVNLTQKVEATMTSEQLKIEIKKELEKGSEKVKTGTGYTFDDEGLTVEKSGSEMKTQITEDGMTVYKNGESVLKANNKGVDAANLHASTYLIIGKNSRLEDYGSKRTACFFIGGGN